MLADTGRTSLELIVQMPPFNCFSRFSRTFCRGLIRGSRAAAVCPAISRHSRSDTGDDSSLWATAWPSFIEPLHSCSLTDGEIQGGTKAHKHRSSPPDTQSHSSTISSQRDCTHSNKHRRRLLSESNYLVLSISMTAGGQQALC